MPELWSTNVSTVQKRISSPFTTRLRYRHKCNKPHTLKKDPAHGVHGSKFTTLTHIYPYLSFLMSATHSWGKRAKMYGNPPQGRKWIKHKKWSQCAPVQLFVFSCVLFIDVLWSTRDVLSIEDISCWRTDSITTSLSSAPAIGCGQVQTFATHSHAVNLMKSVPTVIRSCGSQQNLTVSALLNCCGATKRHQESRYTAH